LCGRRGILTAPSKENEIECFNPNHPFFEFADPAGEAHKDFVSASVGTVHSRHARSSRREQESEAVAECSQTHEEKEPQSAEGPQARAARKADRSGERTGWRPKVERGTRNNTVAPNGLE
jgi:hypothetical protein